MATFIILGKFTQEGIAKIKDSPKRAEAAREVFKSVGAELKETYYTLGQYDFVAIIEDADIEEVTKALLIIGSEGAVRTETLAAIKKDKIKDIIKKMS